MTGIFYAVGVGPGDPELITYKAVRVIKEADIIALPISGSGQNVAMDIAESYIDKNKEIFEFDMPMVRDKQKLDESHDTAADGIIELLKQDKNVVFLTLGDPTVYSTVMYVHKRIKEKGYNTAIIPGVPSFCAVAAALNVPLCERNEILHIIPASYENSDKAFELEGNKVLMKSGKSMDAVKEKLKGKNAMMVECASMQNQKVYHTLENVDSTASYFSVIVVKEDKEIKEY